MTDQFLPFEESFELKKMGFDEPCLCYFNSNKELTLNLNELRSSDIVFSPMYQQVFDFFREKFNLHVIFYDDFKQKFHYNITRTNVLKKPFVYDYPLPFKESRLRSVKSLIQLTKELNPI